MYGYLGQGSHTSARPVIVRAFRQVFRREPTLLEAQFAQGVACVETGGTYDDTYYVNRVTGEKIFDSHNWGSMHCHENPPCPPGCFEATDVGQSCFQRFDSVDGGVSAFIRTLYTRQRSVVLSAASSGDAMTVATAMKQTGYYTAPLEKYADSLDGCVRRIATALGELVPAGARGNLRGFFPPLLIIGAATALFWGTLQKKLW